LDCPHKIVAPRVDNSNNNSCKPYKDQKSIKRKDENFFCYDLFVKEKKNKAVAGQKE